jgi:general secretion pathway protein K
MAVRPARMSPPAGPAGRQRGVALITALLIVALATALAVEISFRQQLHIKRSGAMFELEQARLFGQAVETWAGVILREDREDSEIDYLGEDWARNVGLLPIDEGALSATLEDMQGRFNVNNLVTEGKINAVELERFQRLLTTLELSPEIADAVIDWIDPDTEISGPGGAEDEYYSRQDPPYRTPNRPMRSAQELRLLRKVDEETFRKLQPFVTALPEATPININTAKPEVLMSISPRITPAETERILEIQKEDGYESVGAFINEFEAQEVKEEGAIPPTSLAVASNYFALTAVIKYADARADLTTILRRNEQTGADVIYRSYARDLTTLRVE